MAKDQLLSNNFHITYALKLQTFFLRDEIYLITLLYIVVIGLGLVGGYNL